MSNTDRLPISEMLASFAVDTKQSDVSEVAYDRVLEHVKDCFGVIIAAASEPSGRIVLSVYRDVNPAGTAHVIGSEIVTTPWDAAWANGTLAHLLDFDDTGFSHPTACILPAALAIGELKKCSGSELMTAMAVGYEVFEQLSRSGRAFEYAVRKSGFHPTLVFGCPAAAAAAGRLMGLTKEQMSIALGIASSAAGGLTEQFGTWGKGTQAGNAARAGVMATLLASRDYIASSTVIEGRYGLLNAFLGEGHYDETLIGKDLGRVWSIDDPGLHIKSYPSCGATQRGISAALDVRQQIVDEPADIARIDVSGTDALFHTVHVDFPSRGFEGKFSMRYCLASALADGEVTLETFSDESFARPIVQELMQKVAITVRPNGEKESDPRSLPVSVTLKNGKSASASHVSFLGHASQPMTYEQITAKYLLCASRTLPLDKSRRSSEMLDQLPTTIEIGNLVSAECFHA